MRVKTIWPKPTILKRCLLKHLSSNKSKHFTWPSDATFMDFSWSFSCVMNFSCWIILKLGLTDFLLSSNHRRQNYNSLQLIYCHAPRGIENVVLHYKSHIMWFFFFWQFNNVSTEYTTTVNVCPKTPCFASCLPYLVVNWGSKKSNSVSGQKTRKKESEQEDGMKRTCVSRYFY